MTEKLIKVEAIPGEPFSSLYNNWVGCELWWVRQISNGNRNAALFGEKKHTEKEACASWNAMAKILNGDGPRK